MKKFLFLMISIVLTGIIFWSCSDDGGTSPEPNENTLSCAITSPLDSTGFYAGDSISVIANADDTDGTVIQVRFLLDENGFSADDVFPYTAKIPTNLLTVGTHSIKAIAENDKGKEVSASIDFGIIPTPPTNLTITQLNVYTFSLAWTDNSTGEDGFKVERKIDDGEFVEIAQTIEKTYIDSTVMKKGFGTVYYQVKAFKEIYNSSYTVNNSSVGFPPPTSLSSTKVNLSTISLTWNDNSTGEDGFRIDKKVGDSDWVIEFATVEENIEAWTDSNAEINEIIQYRLYAYKGTNTTSSLIQTVDNAIPAPSNFLVTQTTITSATLTWNDNSIGEDKFEIERKLSTETDYIKIADITGNDDTTKSWTDTTVPNLIYNYRVKSVCNSFNSVYSLKTLDNTFPAPSNFSVSSISITSALLVWTDNSIGEEKFEIERKLSTESTYSKIADVIGSDSATNSWEDLNLIPNLLYDYRIRATNNIFFTSYISESLDNTFTAPNSFTLTQNNVYTFTLNWLYNSVGQDGFKIERKIDDGTYLEINTTTSTSYVDSIVTKKGYNTVYYQIRAYKGTTYFSEYTTSSSSISFPDPTNLNVNKISITNALLTWVDNSIGEERFDIERKLTSESYYVKIGEITGSDTGTKNFNDDTLVPDLIYDYRVKAIKGSNTSNYITVTGYYNQFEPPSNLKTSFDAETSIKLDWTDNSIGEESFIIDRKEGSSGTWIEQYTTVNENIETYTDSGLTPGTTYYYRIRAFYPNYYSNYSNCSADTPGIVSFIEIPTGSFSMGSISGSSDETPVHTVNITRSFYLCKYEVTQQEWILTMGNNPSFYTGDTNRPVEEVRWYSLLVYCNNRSLNEGLTPCYTIDGSTDPSTWGSVPTNPNSTWDAVTCNFSAKGYRLPTEAEWEYVARYNDDRTYPWGETLPSSDLCNYNSNLGSTASVGSYPNGNNYLGFSDMGGNVWEWVWDWYATYSSTVQTNPSGPTTIQTYRVLRGGSWNNTESFLRCSDRFNRTPTILDRVIGFRLARTK